MFINTEEQTKTILLIEIPLKTNKQNNLTFRNVALPTDWKKISLSTKISKTEIKIKGKKKYLKQQKHITLLKLKLKQKLNI